MRKRPAQAEEARAEPAPADATEESRRRPPPRRTPQRPKQADGLLRVCASWLLPTLTQDEAPSASVRTATRYARNANAVVRIWSGLSGVRWRQLTRGATTALQEMQAEAGRRNGLEQSPYTNLQMELLCLATGWSLSRRARRTGTHMTSIGFLAAQGAVNISRRGKDPRDGARGSTCGGVARI